MRRRRRRRPLNPATVCYAVITLLVLLWAVGMPLLAIWLGQADYDAANAVARSGMSLAEDVQARLMTAFFVAWIFFFGASCGSFLNVVAFRMPRGESVVRRGSRCPFCESPIQARDNVPVFGWLGLRGRCRACRLPISPRYPIVEFICGMIFLWLAGFELLSGGANLPEPQPFRRGGIAFVVYAPDWPLITTTLVHGALAGMLLVWSLLELDRARTPFSFVLFGWLLAIATSVWVSGFPPVDWIASRPEWWPDYPAKWQQLESPLLGLLIGLGLGFFFGDRNADRRSRYALLGSGSVIGVMLGWQAVWSVATFSAISLALAKANGRWTTRRFPILLTAVLLHIAFWRALDASRFWPGSVADGWVWISTAVIIVVQWWTIDVRDDR